MTPMRDSLVELHATVDRALAPLFERHRERLSCGRGCSDCCVDGIAVFAVEAARIRASHGELLETGEPHPRGQCAFLDAEGGCRIYAERPYVCRTEGLPLRWYSQADDDSMVDRRDICPLNEPGERLTDLDPDDCWLLGPFEDRLRDLQSRRDGGALERVSLRSLFARTAPGRDQ